jgi:hypothetical protein
VVAKKYVQWGNDFEPVYGVGGGPGYEAPDFARIF